MWNPFKKKKQTSITLSELYKAVEQVAKEKGQTYFSCSIHKSAHYYTTDLGHGEGVYLSGYIHGGNHRDALSIGELVDKLSNYQKQSESSLIQEVYVEKE